MIIKKIKSDTRRRGAETAKYIGDTAHAEPGETFGPKAIGAAHGSLNCLAESWEGAAKEISVAERAYSGDGAPVAHWVIAWGKDERPTPEQEKEAWTIFLQHQGMEGHMLVYAAHDDTEHYHSHALVCRLKPEADADGQYRIQHFGGTMTRMGETIGNGIMKSTTGTGPLPKSVQHRAGI